jgi:predicted ATPase
MDAYLRRAEIKGVFSGRRNIDVYFEPGVNCIHGVNGSGKTVFINLLMGALGCQREYLNKVDFESIDIYIQKQGNQRATKIFTVEVDGDNLAHYTFHHGMQPLDKGTYVAGLAGFRRHFEAIKKGHIISFDLDDDEDYSGSVAHIRSLINSTMATTYVPLLRGSKTQSRPMWSRGEEDTEDPYVNMLNRLQQVFSGRYGNALSNVNRSLEVLKSKIFEKLLFDDNSDSGASSELQDVHRLVGSRDINVLGELDRDDFFNSIDRETLPVSTAQIERHFDIWESIKKGVIDAYYSMKDAEDNHPSDSVELEKAKNKYNESFFKCLASIRFYRRFNDAVTELKILQDKKYKELAPFTSFEHQMNLFLSKDKDFIVSPSGRFEVSFLGEDLRFEDLSSGEKHILAILARVCLSAFSKSTLFVADEPELSLHLEWQRMIIPSIKEVAPDMQVIVATHSPAIIPDDANLISIVECYTDE